MELLCPQRSSSYSQESSGSKTSIDFEIKPLMSNPTNFPHNLSLESHSWICRGCLSVVTKNNVCTQCKITQPFRMYCRYCIFLTNVYQTSIPDLSLEMDGFGTQTMECKPQPETYCTTCNHSMCKVFVGSFIMQ